MVHDGQHAVMLCDDKFPKCQFSCPVTPSLVFFHPLTWAELSELSSEWKPECNEPSYISSSGSEVLTRHDCFVSIDNDHHRPVKWAKLGQEGFRLWATPHINSWDTTMILLRWRMTVNCSHNWKWNIIQFSLITDRLLRIFDFYDQHISQCECVPVSAIIPNWQDLSHDVWCVNTLPYILCSILRESDFTNDNQQNNFHSLIRSLALFHSFHEAFFKHFETINDSTSI